MEAIRKTIVVVDDSPLILKLARNILMGTYNVVTAPSGAKLFQYLALCPSPPDLILLDIMMPEQNGLEIIQVLKKDKKTIDIPVIFLTSKSDPESEVEGLSLGAVDYISKPFSPPLLLKHIELHLLLEKQRQEILETNNKLQQLVEMKSGTIIQLKNSLLRTMSNLVECRDDVTGKHVERTEKLLSYLVEEMFDKNVYISVLKEWDIDLLIQSSQLHDIGKISVRDAVLLKPGKLDADEFDEIKKHTLFGEEIIDKIQQTCNENVFLAHAKIMAVAHHERWDGTGYPYNLAGKNIPLQGRMMAFADVYDALVSERPYKKPFEHGQAIKIIRDSSGTHFDPAIVDVFVAAADRFYADNTNASAA